MCITLFVLVMASNTKELIASIWCDVKMGVFGVQNFGHLFVCGNSCSPIFNDDVIGHKILAIFLDLLSAVVALLYTVVGADTHIVLYHIKCIADEFDCLIE